MDKQRFGERSPGQGPAKTKDAYVGPPFRVNRTFAERFADKWIILSAKYGLIDPDFIIPEDYDVTFTKPSTNPNTVEDIRKQLKDMKDLHGYDAVIALGGQVYPFQGKSSSASCTFNLVLC